MSFLRALLLVAGLHLLACSSMHAADSYELLDGRVINAPPVSFTKDGVAFRDAAGDQGERIAYTNLTQQALQELAKNQRGKRHVEPFLEAPLDPAAVKGRPAFELKPHDTLERPDPQGGLQKLASSGLGLVLLLLLATANLYSAYEVGVFRNYPPFMVLGISVVLPVVTQVVFLCLPTYVRKAAEEVVDATGAHVPAFAAPGSNQAAAAAAVAAASGHAAAEAAALPRFKKGDFTFNKRFFETKLSGFFGIRPSEAEKGMLFMLKAGKGQLLCNRVVRVTPADACVQVLRGTSMEEVSVPYSDIVEIEIQHRG